MLRILLKLFHTETGQVMSEHKLAYLLQLIDIAAHCLF